MYPFPSIPRRRYFLYRKGSESFKQYMRMKNSLKTLYESPQGDRLVSWHAGPGDYGVCIIPSWETKPEKYAMDRCGGFGQ